VNARDAMPDGGSFIIETKNVDLGEVTAAIYRDSVPGPYILMTVTDNGQGMDEAIRDRVFEPFFTTKEVGRGTGLGLSTVYGIVRQSGGWIDLWSEPGLGTSFKIYFPLVDACPLARIAGRNVAVEGGSETILVVEDQEAVRSFAKTVLKGYGYHVLEASNGREALAAAKRSSGEIHLLLTDVILPGMNCKVLSENMKGLCPDLKVLFMSGYSADIIAHHGVVDHGIAYIMKPFSPDELAAKIRGALGFSLNATTERSSDSVAGASG